MTNSQAPMLCTERVLIVYSYLWRHCCKHVYFENKQLIAKTVLYVYSKDVQFAKHTSPQVCDFQYPYCRGSCSRCRMLKVVFCIETKWILIGRRRRSAVRGRSRSSTSGRRLFVRLKASLLLAWANRLIGTYGHWLLDYRLAPNTVWFLSAVIV